MSKFDLTPSSASFVRVTHDDVYQIMIDLEHNSTLTSLNLANNHVEMQGQCAQRLTDGLCEHSIPNTTLKHLNLDNNGLGGQYNESFERLIQALQTHTHVDSLELRHNQLADHDVAHLVAHPTLRRLNLEHNKITSLGAQKIADGCLSSMIESLNLGSNPIGDKGAEYLSVALNHGAKLTRLILADCNLTDVGADAIIDVLKHHHSSLHELDVARNQISAEQMQVLVRAAMNNRHIIQLTTGDIELDDALKRYFRDRNNATAAQNVNALVANLTAIKSPSKYLVDITGLDAYDMMANLTDTQRLTFINERAPVTFVSDLTDGLMDNQSKNTTLKFLNLDNNALGGKSNNELQLFINALEDMTEIEVLELRHNQLTDHDVAHLVAHKSLRKLNLEHNNVTSIGAETIARALATSNLASLDLESNLIGDAGVTFLAEALKNGCQLTRLILEDCNITDVGANVLVDVLKHHASSLQELDIARNQISPEMMHKLMHAALENEKITALTTSDLKLNNLLSEYFNNRWRATYHKTTALDVAVSKDYHAERINYFDAKAIGDKEKIIRYIEVQTSIQPIITSLHASSAPVSVNGLKQLNSAIKIMNQQHWDKIASLCQGKAVLLDAANKIIVAINNDEASSTDVSKYAQYSDILQATANLMNNPNDTVCQNEFKNQISKAHNHQNPSVQEIGRSMLYLVVALVKLGAVIVASLLWLVSKTRVNEVIDETTSVARGVFFAKPKSTLLSVEMESVEAEIIKSSSPQNI